MNDANQAAAPGFHPWLKGEVSRAPALFVVGNYRCGTTSLFAQLAAHPEMNPSLIKEPGFFFSRTIGTPRGAYPAGRELEAYLSMFRRQAPARVLLEGSATYLNDPGCAERIRRAFPEARILIALRDPVARLVSWYKFIQIRSWWDGALGFEAWIREQLTDPRPLEARPYHLQAVEHGHYSRYLAEYLRVFGRDRVHFVWFDELIADQRKVAQAVSRFIGIDPGFYESYGFPRENESMKITRPRLFAAYQKSHRLLFRLLRPIAPMLEHELKVQLFGRLEPSYIGFFTGPADPVEVSPALKAELRALYRPDVARLAELTGREPGW